MYQSGTKIETREQTTIPGPMSSDDFKNRAGNPNLPRHELEQLRE
jgi:hypothetical protein